VRDFAFKQFDAQFRFQLGDLMRQGRLADIDFIRRPRKVFLFRDFHCILQLMQFHKLSSIRLGWSSDQRAYFFAC
jgi:hypothetical protein